MTDAPMPADPVVALLPVTQADRNFAADYGIRFGRFGELYRRAIEDGHWDHTDDVQMVARHRLAHRTPAPAGDVREGCVGTMTPERATYFLERFKREEKWLGPHEQWALDYTIAALASPTPDSSAVSGSAGGLREALALRAIKAVTATAKEGAAGLSRIMAIAIAAGVKEPYTELLADPDVALIVERPRTEWAHLFKSGVTGCALPPEGWRCTRARGHSGPCAALTEGQQS